MIAVWQRAPCMCRTWGGEYSRVADPMLGAMFAGAHAMPRQAQTRWPTCAILPSPIGIAQKGPNATTPDHPMGRFMIVWSHLHPCAWAGYALNEGLRAQRQGDRLASKRRAREERSADFLTLPATSPQRSISKSIAIGDGARSLARVERISVSSRLSTDK